jgi:hypothetical protein
MTSLSHDGGESLFFEAVEVDAMCLLGLSFLVELNPWSSESDVGRKYLVLIELVGLKLLLLS